MGEHLSRVRQTEQFSRAPRHPDCMAVRRDERQRLMLEMLGDGGESDVGTDCWRWNGQRWRIVTRRDGPAALRWVRRLSSRCPRPRATPRVSDASVDQRRCAGSRE
jgi:hypothetical protein